MRKIVVAFVLNIVAVSVAFAGPITYPIGMASTAGFVQGAGSGPTPRGWDFNISQPITVEQMGVNAAVNINITMSLWDVTTQTLLGQTRVNSQAYTWEFANLDTPINLTPGDVFSVIGWADTTGASPWYLFQDPAPPAFTPTGTVNYLNVRYDNSSGPDQFPTSTLPTGQFGVADIGYTTNLPAVPEPTTLALFGIGLAVGGLRRRKRTM